MTAYYNENDPKAAAWLRELIAGGHIAPGDVDDRSIKDVHADDLRGYAQCHFFAGIGGWSLALRLAGWPDDRPVWTGSCPCPPFSSAGKGQLCPTCHSKRNLCHPRRTGYFICLDCGCSRFADDRHLWPEVSRLIVDGDPTVFFGEQVASKDGLHWFATVRADLERTGRGVGAVDIPAAGVGAPHWRQRLWFVAERLADSSRQEGERGLRRPCEGDRQILGQAQEQRPERSGTFSELAHSQQPGLERHPGHGDRGGEPGRVEAHAAGPATAGGEPHGLGHPDDQRRAKGAGDATGQAGSGGEGGLHDPRSGGDGRASPLDGFWRDVDWLHCTDGKWRPVESIHECMAHGLPTGVDGVRLGGDGWPEGFPPPACYPLAENVTHRVGLLRGYGNAIVPQVGAEVIGAYMEVRDGQSA